MKAISLIVFLILGLSSFSQELFKLDSIQPDSNNYENIYIKKLVSDEEQSSFLIWVKDSVQAHYHAIHSENVLILAGKARMTVNGEEQVAEAGDFMNFPKGMVHAVLEVVSDEPLKVLSIQCPEFFGKDRIFVHP
jgi:quercetin dioxygenase-like cupin family protein